MVAKKSFFERLTGATSEEILEKEPKDEIEPLKKVELEKPQNQPKAGRPRAETKKKPDKKPEPIANEWSSDEEGQMLIDVCQTENNVIIKSTIAGVKSEDIDVAITNDMIIIKGIRRRGESVPQENYYYQELYWGPFSRSVILPVDVVTEKAHASIKNGILTIKLPKAEKIKTKTIKVKDLEQ